MKKTLKLLLCAGFITVLLVSLCGCIDDIADGMHKAGDWLEENKEPIEEGLGKVQSAVIDASDKVNDFLHDQEAIQTTKVPEEVKETTKGMMY